MIQRLFVMIKGHFPGIIQSLTISLVCVGVLVLMAPAVRAENLELGATVFQTHCEGCHINGGNILRRGKNLKTAALKRNGYDSIEAVTKIVTQGKSNMSSFRDRLSPEEIAAVSAYVLAQAETDWKS